MEIIWVPSSTCGFYNDRKRMRVTFSERDNAACWDHEIKTELSAKPVVKRPAVAVTVFVEASFY